MNSSICVHMIRCRLFVKLVADALNELAYPADLAGLVYGVSNSQAGFQVWLLHVCLVFEPWSQTDVSMYVHWCAVLGYWHVHAVHTILHAAPSYLLHAFLAHSLLNATTDALCSQRQYLNMVKYKPGGNSIDH